MSKPGRAKINFILEMCAAYHDNWAADFDDNPHSEPVGEFDSRDVSALCTALIESMDRVEAERKRAIAAIHWVFSADGTVGERAMAQEAIHKINDPTFLLGYVKSLGGSNER
jgi:hypothetical protein